MGRKGRRGRPCTQHPIRVVPVAHAEPAVQYLATLLVELASTDQGAVPTELWLPPAHPNSRKEEPNE